MNNLFIYQASAQRTSNANTPSDKLENGILGLCGESGECADLLKKYLYQGHQLDRDKLIEELGDVMWYLAEAATGLEISLADIAERNISKLQARYPEGFDPERSIHRPEYEGQERSNEDRGAAFLFKRHNRTL